MTRNRIAIIVILALIVAWLYRRLQTINTPDGRVYTGASNAHDPYRQEMEQWLQSQENANGK